MSLQRMPSWATSPWSIRHAAHILKQGGVIAYPTESVFGLGCLPDKTASIRSLLQLKQRPEKKGLILIAANLSQLEPYISPLADNVLQKLLSTCPQPTTWVVPTPPQTSLLLKGEFQSIAVRITTHPVVRELCLQCQSAIISTSANQSNKNMSYSAFDVRLHFKDELDYILNGSLGDNDKPSIIINALNDRIIRS